MLKVPRNKEVHSTIHACDFHVVQSLSLSLSLICRNIGNFPANAKVPLPRERRSLVRKFPGKSLNQAEYDGIPSINVYSETPSEVPEKYRYAGKCEG